MLYSDPSKVKRVITKYIWKGIYLIIMRSYSFTLKRYYNIVVSNSIYTIVLVLIEERERLINY
jgi:hypothetical protein